MVGGLGLPGIAVEAQQQQAVGCQFGGLRLVYTDCQALDAETTLSAGF